MNLLEEIQNAPVEWKELGEVCIIANTARKPVKANDRISGEIPYYGANNIQDYVEGYTHDGEYILIAEDGSAKLDEYSIQYVNGKFWANNHVHVIKPKENLLSRFIYHYLTNFDFKPYLSGGTRAKLTKASLVKIPLPVPSLEIQEKIVQTLDKFTDYVTELTSELTLRQKQYSYFRDYLLNFDQDSSGRTNNKVEWKTLGEVCLSTKTISWKSEDEQKQFKYIDLSSVSRENKKITDVTIITKSTAPSRAQKIIKKDDILFATTRPMLKRFTKVTKEYNYQICSTGFCVLRPSDKILSNYLYHLVASSNFYDYVERNQSGASYPAISDNLVKNYQFPLPPLSIQEKIVHVLDNFDTVCNDLNIGLPKEIELRQKQYEYFRDQLLTYTAEGVYTDSTVQYSTVQTRPN